jgi:sugar-specific transcriptional regulator TrmB
MKIVYPEEIMTAKIKELEKENEELKREIREIKRLSDPNGDLDYDFMEAAWRN